MEDYPMTNEHDRHELEFTPRGRADDAPGFKERFIAQCVVCAVLLAVVMTVRLINPGGLNGAIEGFKSVLAQNFTIDDAQKALKGLTGGGAPAAASASPTPTAQPSASPAVTPSTAPSAGIIIETQAPTAGPPAEVNSALDNKDFRIDEDMLSQMNNEPVYGQPSPNQ